VWWPTYVILALHRLGQEDHAPKEANLRYLGKIVSKINKKKEKSILEAERSLWQVSISQKREGGGLNCKHCSIDK
jgi:hypothetical protein